jgi:hypothetical protein
VWIEHTTSLSGGITLTVIGAPNQGLDPAVWEHSYFINGMKVTWPSTFSDGDVNNLSVKEFGSGWLLVSSYQGQGVSLPHLSRLALYQPSTGTFIDYGYVEW